MNKEKKGIDDAGSRNFEELTSNFVKFEEIGQEIEGEIINIDSETSQDVTLYSIKDDDGVVRKFHDSTQLKDLLAQVKLGDYIKVIYVADNPMAQGKSLKVFKVLRSS